MKTSITVDRKYSLPAFGETRLCVDYYFTTNGRCKNTYLVTCRIVGIEIGDISLSPISSELASFQEVTNEETLIESAVLDLFLETIS